MVYMAEGGQTEITPLVEYHAENIRQQDWDVNLEEPILSIQKTCKYISQLPLLEETDPEDGEKIKEVTSGGRCIDQILQEGIYDNTDIGLLFRGLMITQGIPTSYIEAFHERSLFNQHIQTHSYGRVSYGRGLSLIVDPKENPELYHAELEILPHVILGEGLDRWDLGIYNTEDLHEKKEDTLDFLVERYKNNLKHLKRIESLT